MTAQQPRKTLGYFWHGATDPWWPPMTQPDGLTSAPPKEICGYPIPGWRLDHVQYDVREKQPDGWIVSLTRESPNWQEHKRSYVVMARSDIGPLEAWDEALKIALREDERESARKAMVEKQP